MAQPASFPSPAWLLDLSAHRPAPARSLPSGIEALGFELHPDPQLIVSADGEVVAANRAARERVVGVCGRRGLAGPLLAENGNILGVLCEQVELAIRTQSPAPKLELPLLSALASCVEIVPLGSQTSCALLIVREREPAPPSRGAAHFGFTRREQVVAERLASSLTVPQIAQQLGISIETVRCHLKQAFAKAGVHRQAELVAVMLRG